MKKANRRVLKSALSLLLAVSMLFSFSLRNTDAANVNQTASRVQLTEAEVLKELNYQIGTDYGFSKVYLIDKLTRFFTGLKLTNPTDAEITEIKTIVANVVEKQAIDYNEEAYKRAKAQLENSTVKDMPTYQGKLNALKDILMNNLSNPFTAEEADYGANKALAELVPAETSQETVEETSQETVVETVTETVAETIAETIAEPAPVAGDYAKVITLNDVSYIIGEDIPSGKAVINLISGSGNLAIYDANHQDIFSEYIQEGFSSEFVLPKAGTINLRDTLKNIEVTISYLKDGFEEAKADPVEKVTNIKDGHYIIGKDIDAGTVDLYNVFSAGNVTIYDENQNLLFNKFINNLDGVFNNVLLPINGGLNISLNPESVFKLEYSSISKQATPAADNSIEYKEGNYIIGEDIKSGVVDIHRLQGAGNITIMDENHTLIFNKSVGNLEGAFESIDLPKGGALNIKNNSLDEEFVLKMNYLEDGVKLADANLKTVRLTSADNGLITGDKDSKLPFGIADIRRISGNGNLFIIDKNATTEDTAVIEYVYYLDGAYNDVVIPENATLEIRGDVLLELEYSSFKLPGIEETSEEVVLPIEETTEESVAETPFETESESEAETPVESESESESKAETPAESVEESIEETTKETVKETDKETTKETKYVTVSKTVENKKNPKTGDAGIVIELAFLAVSSTALLVSKKKHSK